jgi:TM2 domain-containing membrane protein YozV
VEGVVQMDDFQKQLLNETRYNAEKKSIAIAYILFFIAGGFGAHRFYLGKTGTAFLFIFTFGGLGVWWLWDLLTHARQVDIYNGNLRNEMKKLL